MGGGGGAHKKERGGGELQNLTAKEGGGAYQREGIKREGINREGLIEVLQ